MPCVSTGLGRGSQHEGVRSARRRRAGSACRAYSAGVFRLVTVPAVAVAVAALGAPVPAAAAAGAVDPVPVLTSMPFGAAPGQRVTHTITLSGSGTGPASAVRVTFTTTVDLDGPVARTTSGRCTVVSARAIACDVGNLRFPAAVPPTIAIIGTVHGAAPGALVQNRVTVQSAHPAADPAGEVVSNAYLIAGAGTPPTARPTARGYAVAAHPGPRGRPSAVVTAAVTAGLAAAVLALVGLLMFRRRRTP